MKASITTPHPVHLRAKINLFLEIFLPPNLTEKSSSIILANDILSCTLLPKKAYYIYYYVTISVMKIQNTTITECYKNAQQ